MTGASPECVGVVGLGYVGLPLALGLARAYPVVAFDEDPARIQELRAGKDHTGEVPSGALQAADGVTWSEDPRALAACTFLIIAVPTPITADREPDLSALRAACHAIGAVIQPGALVVVESTVYPGVTEEVCAPLLEAASGMGLGDGFDVGYSPERINPGDPEHRLEDIVKVVAASSPQALARMESVYGAVVRAGLHRAPSIRVAEAAKVIENTQRDLNIALMNELSVLFERLGLDTTEVLAAAGTKWNFLPFRPGLVGGHCIGVDPYYLTWKARQVGHEPELILAGRRLNDGMGTHAAQRLVAALERKGVALPEASALVLGLTFKEDCPDTRNSRVVDLIRTMESSGIRVDVHDPRADAAAVQREHGITLLEGIPGSDYDAVVLAVPHAEYLAQGVAGLRRHGKEGHLFFDVKSAFPVAASDLRL